MASYFLAGRFLPIYFIDFKWIFFFRFCMYIFFFPAEVAKNALKDLWTPKDTTPAVKISGPDCHPCSKPCVFVCQRLIPLQPSHLHILPLRPHPIPRIQPHFVRSDCAAVTKKGCKCSSGHLVCPSNCCHVAGTMCSPLFWELCFTVQEGARSYWDSKEINRIGSSLAEITLAFALYQILFCPKGCLPAREPHFKLYYWDSHVKKVSVSKQQSNGKSS